MQRDNFEGENGPAHDMPGHVRRSIYSKRLGRGQHQYGADVDGLYYMGTYLRHMANTIEPSLCDGDAVFIKLL